MKKFLAMLLAVLTVCSFAACAAKPAENDTADVEIADALYRRREVPGGGRRL